LLALAKRLGETGQIRDITKFRNEGDKIFAFKPQPERFLCFFFTGRKVIITNAFHKKSNKLPQGEKDRALRTNKDFEERFKKGTYYEGLKKIQK
jgi:phage-related protein